MANTTNINDTTVTIKFDGATDWVYTSITGSADCGLKVRSILFDPSGENDVMIIKSSRLGIADTSSAAIVFPVKCSGDTDQRAKSYGGDNGQIMFPFVDATDITLSSASAASLTIELA
jgi:hypothetical protein